MSNLNQAGIATWLKTRPAVVQALAREFPFGTLLRGASKEAVYVIGWTESDDLILSPHDPELTDQHSHDQMVADKHYACAKHYRA